MIKSPITLKSKLFRQQSKLINFCLRRPIVFGVIAFFLCSFLITAQEINKKSEEQFYLELKRIEDEVALSNPKEAAELLESLVEEQAAAITDTLQVYFYLTRMAVYQNLGDFQLALSDLQNALAASKRSNNFKQARVFISTGHLYAETDSLELALENYKSAAAVSLSENSDNGLIVAYNSIGQTFQDMDLYDSALAYFGKNVQLIESMSSPDSTYLGAVYGSYANISREFEYLKGQAIEYQLKGLEISEATKDTVAIVIKLANLATMYVEEGFYEQYEETAQKAIDISKSQSLDLYTKAMYKLFYQNEEEYGNYEKALEYYIAYSEMENELLNEDLQAEIKDWQLTLDNQKKDEELRAQETREKGLMIIVGLVLLVLVLIIYFNIQSRRSRLKLQIKNEELDALNATKDKFFSIIAHDLRSPMIGLQGVGQKLEYFIKKDKQEKLLEMGEKIDQSVDQLNHLLNNLLNWAASETGNIPNNPDNIDLKELVVENIALYNSLAKTKSVKIIDETTSQLAYADANMVSTIIRNLLSNAIKFTKKGGKVVLKTSAKENNVQLHIHDQGPGISKTQIEEIHKGIIQSKEGSGKEKGFGLGLKLCLDFVLLNKGKLTIDSPKEGGTQFSFSLPTKDLSVEASLRIA